MFIVSVCTRYLFDCNTNKNKFHLQAITLKRIQPQRSAAKLKGCEYLFSVYYYACLVQFHWYSSLDGSRFDTKLLFNHFQARFFFNLLPRKNPQSLLLWARVEHIKPNRFWPYTWYLSQMLRAQHWAIVIFIPFRFVCVCVCVCLRNGHVNNSPPPCIPSNPHTCVI